MTPQQAVDIVTLSLRDLLNYDSYLLVKDVSERSITHKLAEHIGRRLPPFELERPAIIAVDCEYNRNGEDPKYIDFLLKEQSRAIQRILSDVRRQRYADDAIRSISVYPDIIIHERGENRNNLLVIEAKKLDNSGGDEYDVFKLTEYTRRNGMNPYHYRFGAFIVFETDCENPPLPQIRWFMDGNECERPI